MFAAEAVEATKKLPVRNMAAHARIRTQRQEDLLCFAFIQGIAFPFFHIRIIWFMYFRKELAKAPEKSIEFQIIDFIGYIPQRLLACQEH